MNQQEESFVHTITIWHDSPHGPVQSFLLWLGHLDPIRPELLFFCTWTDLFHVSISPDQAAYLISLLAVVSFPTTLFAGWILSKVKIHHTAMAISFFMGAALAVLLLTKGLPGAVVFTLLLGSAMGLQTVWGGLVWPNYFGTRYLGSIRSLAMSATVLGSAFGPIPFGFAYDLTGSYSIALTGMIVLSGFGILVASGSPRPVHAGRFKNDDEYID